VFHFRVTSWHLTGQITGQTEDNHENTELASRSTADNCAKIKYSSPEWKSNVTTLPVPC
jgi:hypothetical protein